MTRSPDLRAINCTACGAGLDVLGGGRVATHICPYCGTALDAQADYKVIASYSGIVRPSSPLRPGMSGQIDGVTFTVIGTLGWEERYGGRTWTWVDHQVFSPTHGYAWLTVEDGHLIFSRRYRKPCFPDFITSATVERAATSRRRARPSAITKPAPPKSPMPRANSTGPRRSATAPLWSPAWAPTRC